MTRNGKLSRRETCLSGNSGTAYVSLLSQSFIQALDFSHRDAILSTNVCDINSVDVIRLTDATCFAEGKRFLQVQCLYHFY